METPRNEKSDCFFQNIIQKSNKNIFRCLGDVFNINEKCYEIPFQELFFSVQINEKTNIKKIDNIYIKLQCPIHLTHNHLILLDWYLKDEDNRNKFSKIKCICNDSNNQKYHQNLFYCIKDNIFIGNDLYEKHLNHSDYENFLIEKEKFDSFCKFHNSKINKFCSICNQNLCNDCLEFHKKKHINKINNNENFIKELYNEINDCDEKLFNNKIKEANNFFKKMNDKIRFVISNCQNKSLINDIKQYVNLNTLMFIYLKEVYHFYKENNEHNNLNYQIIFNFKKIFQQFSLPKIFECYENGAKHLKLFKDYINNINNFILKIDELNYDKDDFNEKENQFNITGISNQLEEENNEEVIDNNENSNFHFNISKFVNFGNNIFKFYF